MKETNMNKSIGEFYTITNFFGETVFGSFVNQLPKSVKFSKEMEVQEGSFWYTYKMYTPTRENMKIAYLVRKKSNIQ